MWRKAPEEEDGDALDSATHGRVEAAKATATVANLDDLAGLDHLGIGADDAVAGSRLRRLCEEGVESTQATIWGLGGGKAPARTAASSAACALAATAAEVDLPDVNFDRRDG